MPLAPDSLEPTISIGEILAEVVATTIGSGFSEPIPMIGPFPSGAPTSFIVQCSRIGGSAAMIGAVGDDAFGQLNLERMKREGVDVSGISVDPDLPTGTAFVRYRPDGTRDFVFNLWTSAAGRLAWTGAVDAVEEIDPTGAGDCFGGAYVATRRLGLSVDQALIYANAAGARNVTRRGPMEGAGSRSELDAFIAGTERITCSS